MLDSREYRFYLLKAFERVEENPGLLIEERPVGTSHPRLRHGGIAEHIYCVALHLATP